MGIQKTLLFASLLCLGAFFPSVSPPRDANAAGADAMLFAPVAVKHAPDESSSLFVQNISPLATNITVRFYDQSGFSDPAWTRNAPIPPGESVIIDLTTERMLPWGFDGSAVAQSPQLITGVVNRLDLNGLARLPSGEFRAARAGASGGSFSLDVGAAAGRQSIPVAFGGYHGYFTTVSVQNTAQAPGAFTLALYPTGAPISVASITRIIPAMSVSRIRLGSENGVPPDFVGTVAIDPPAGIAAAVAAETINIETGVTLSYAGFSASTTTMNAPLLFKNYNGWVSGAQVVNTSTSPVVVNASILQRDGPISLNLRARPLAPNESLTYYLPAINELPDGFVGSGVFTATGPIAVVVQEINEGRGAGMAYSGFNMGTPNVSVPVAFKGSAGWDSGIQVQNLGQTDTWVRIVYHLQGGLTAGDEALIAAGSSTTFYQEAHPGIPPGSVGAAIITSLGGQPIVAIVNEVNYTHPGDATMAYEGINF